MILKILDHIFSSSTWYEGWMLSALNAVTGVNLYALHLLCTKIYLLSKAEEQTL